MSKFDRRLKRPVNRCGITGKRLFKSPQAAMQFVANLGADCNAPMMREYHCPLCGGFHLTSRDYEPSRRSADFQRHQEHNGSEER
jgi:hypothetical protein